MKLLLGTTNQGKLKEAKQLLSDLKFDLLSLDDLENLPEIIVEENGETFAENALLKAQAYGHLSGILTLAEDAGLEVNTLDGKPGVKSARLGVNADVRNRKLLSLLKNKKDRSARFVSVFCLYDPQTKKTDYFRGEIEGKISTELKGNQGFDYDYLFIPEGYEQTFAELGVKVKNKISHRRQAIEKLKTLMLSLLGE